MDKLLENLQSTELDVREHALREAGQATSSNREIVGALLKIRETCGSITFIDLARQALEAPAHQTVLRANPDLERAVIYQVAQQEQAEKAEIQRRAQAEAAAKQIWIRAEEAITWPAVCARCGKAGELTTNVEEHSIILRLLKTFAIPFLRFNTYAVQPIRPPYCQDCAGAIKKYKKVSASAEDISLFAIFGMFSLGQILIISYVNLNGSLWLILAGLWLAASILAGVGVYKWYFKAKGNPPRALPDVKIYRFNEANGQIKIRLEFANSAYRELFRKTNQPILTTPASSS